MEKGKKNTLGALTKQDIDDSLKALQNNSKKNEYLMLFGSEGLKMFDELMNRETWKARLLKTLKDL